MILVYNYFYMPIKGKGSAKALKNNNKPMHDTQSFFLSSQNNERSNVRKKNLKEAEKKNVIQIPTDEEEKESFENTLQNQHLQYEISKAQLTGNRFQVILTVMKYYLPVPIEEKESKMKELILQYFLTNANINLEEGYFCQRIDAGLCFEPGRVYENKYILFGVDLLTTKKILARYSRFKPLLKWVDASHCILEFESIQEGWDFLSFQIFNYNTAKIIPWDLNSNVLARNWLQLNSFYEICFTRRLFVRNFTQADERYIATRQAPPQSFDIYKNSKIDFQNFMLSNENVKRVMQKIDEQERQSRMMDPNYKNIMRKKRIEQKKIQSLISERNQNNQHNRSRSRDDERNRRQNNKYGDYHEKEYEPKHYSHQFESVAYKGNPKIYPERYNLHKIHNPNPRPRPPYATPEKMNEIRSQLNQRPDLNQSFTSYPEKANSQDVNSNGFRSNKTSVENYTAPEFDNELNMSFISENPNQQNQQGVVLQKDVNQHHNQEHLSRQNHNPYVKIQRGHPDSVSHPSSDFQQIQSQFQKFHINSAEYSSIFERSKHNYSQLNFQDSNQLSTSNVLSSNFNSNHNNNSQTLFEPEFEKQMGIIPHSNDRIIGKIEEEDEDICDILNTTNKISEKPQEIQEVDFKITKKALDPNDFSQLPEPPKLDVNQVVKKPRKKAQNKATTPMPTNG